ncbi:Sorbitol dehydrogenase [Chlorella sorokiniana]|uniref:Sorbitol dehydrogenase n=1 Tax=Chlorella sorokiniana TaxID=3076 RepID=A0A2P6TZP4_CHLSO|nr:Sorbitol dehydrogenase [Chlorella sorokiniana]|eukprot:PRW59528.1 Sorbitol dehydrogenase [Chlorella sorokiniana]
MVIGHEAAGTVEAVGPGVTQLQPGDKAALEPGVPCCAHHQYREGRYNLAPIQFFATPPVHGCLAERVDHPAEWCYKLPPGLSLEQGAMCEPLSVGVHACRRGGVQPGKKVAIMGAGPIGLVTLLAAKAFGADSVAITDLKQPNLELAKQLGADATLQTSVLGRAEDVAAELRQAAAAPDGFEVVIDCAGFQQTMQAALKACADGGRIVLVGMGQEEMTLGLTEACIREVDIVGSFRYCNTYPLCLSLLASGRVNVEPLITHRFGFDAASLQQGFETAHLADQTGAVKVMFNLA